MALEGGAGGYNVVTNNFIMLNKSGGSTQSFNFIVGSGGANRWASSAGAGYQGGSTYITRSNNKIIFGAGGGGYGGYTGSGGNGTSSITYFSNTLNLNGTEVGCGGGSWATNNCTGYKTGGRGNTTYKLGGGGGGAGSDGYNANTANKTATKGGDGILISLSAYGFPDNASPSYGTVTAPYYCAGASSAPAPTGSWTTQASGIGGTSTAPVQNTGSGGMASAGSDGFIVFAIESKYVSP